MPYIPRSLEPVLKKRLADFPALVLTGPRQSGKTTLLRHVLGKRYTYAALDLSDVREVATSDPRGFLEAYPPPVIFDEVQYAPELLPYIRERIDRHREKAGQYVLTGSQNLLMLEKVTESLAGRVAILRLLPLTQRELDARRRSALPWEIQRFRRGEVRALGELWRQFLRGWYPELGAHPRRDSHPWHASYVETYLERDVRSLRQVGDLAQFYAFLRLLAARSGQLLNLADLGRDLGVAVNTCKAWLSILEATYQVIIVRPYHANVGKRLVKMPKVYFTDVGTLCHLARLRDPEHAAAGPLGSAILETAVLSEIVKTHLHRGDEAAVHFWRTSAGLEVDFLAEYPDRLVPIEVKLSATPRPKMGASIRQLQRDLGDRCAPGYVVHPGDVRLPLGHGVQALPFGDL